MCFVLGFSPSWKVPVRSGGAEPTAHSCGPPHERSQLPGDYRAPGAWGGGRSTRAVALSSLPCLTPPFMSASLATLSFPPLPLLSLHLASFPCLPPSPSRCTWLCWLPLHPSCHPPHQDPALSSSNPQPPAPTSPALASCPCARSAPPSSPSPAKNLPLPWGEEEGWHNELGMLVDPDVPPCRWHPPSSAPAGGQRKGTHSCSSQGWAPSVRGLWSRGKGKWWVPYSHGSYACARDQCPSHTS